MDSWTNFYHRQTTLEEQCLYDHFLERVEVESLGQLLKRFRSLFIDGVSYSDPQVWRSLGKLVSSKLADKEFKFILYRCSHILINRWQMQPRLHAAIPALVALFEMPPSGIAQSQTTLRLRRLVGFFLQSDQFAALKRLAQVMHQAVEAEQDVGNQPLGTLIRRYPCLYEHCLLAEGSTGEQRHRILQIRRQMQRQVEFDLSRYATAQLQRSPLGSVKNPTLLSDRQLNFALKHFTGKIDGTDTYRDQAQKFLTYSKQARSYREFKEDLYDYLIDSIEPDYGKHQFNQLLYAELQNLLAESDAQKLHNFDFLLSRTCMKLLNFLVVESPQNLHHFVFVDLIQNLGSTPTIGLLLKIVLLCKKVKFHLEKRFSILFNHYESHTRDGVSWLVDSLENLNVALSTNFGGISLCY